MLSAAIKNQTLVCFDNAALGGHNKLAAVALDSLACMV